jgi:hypothetical protein
MFFNILNIDFLGNSLGAGSDASISELIFCKKVGKIKFYFIFNLSSRNQRYKRNNKSNSVR